LKDLKSSLGILERIGDRYGLCHTYFSIAWISWVRGETSLARKEAIRLLEMSPDEELKARALLLLGGIGIEDGAWAQASDWFSKADATFGKLGSSGGKVLACVLRAGADMLGTFDVETKGPKAKRTRKKVVSSLSKIGLELEDIVSRARDEHLPRARAYAELRRAQAMLLMFLADTSDDKVAASGPFEALSGKAQDLVTTFTSLRDSFGAPLARVVAGLALSFVDKDLPRSVELIKGASDELGRSSLDLLSGLLLLHLEKVYSRTGDTFGAESSRKAAEALGVVPRRR